MRYLVEFYLPNSGCDLAEIAGRAEAGARRAAARATGRGSAVSFLSAIYLAEDESCLAIYEAGSPDLVRAAGALAGLDFDHVAEISVCVADPGEISA
ncbi:MAG TPA: hypothetical protein VGM14_22460 [Streptosporangiaceae bacterium]|jgi:hypothetical protein